MAVQGQMVATTWLDNKPCHFLSTIHAASGEHTVWCTSRTGDTEDFNCLPCVPDYQWYTEGVDWADQRISIFNVGHKTSQWTRQMFFQLIEMSVNNGFVIYKHALNLASIELAMF